jgi:hypothetical protein
MLLVAIPAGTVKRDPDPALAVVRVEELRV